jgi:aspartyl-tRNA(Asn)/glutamyl-tRNA(Gln) amidotransferase subunit A
VFAETDADDPASARRLVTRHGLEPRTRVTIAAPAAVSDETRELFRAQYGRLRAYRPAAPEVVPAYGLAAGAMPPAPPAPARIERLPRKTLSASEAVERQRDGRTTAAALLEACLEKIDRLDPTLHAFVRVMRAEAHARAAELDRRRARGEPLGPLHGVPVAIKDLIDVAGVPSTARSRVRRHAPPAARDAPVVARLEAAGAVIVGKSETHEFACGVSTPQSRNPWDPERLAGGSSGGSAVAVASGMALASLGTDTRGSIRVPSALCGLVGLKPTFGLVPRSGCIPLAWTMDHIGPITRTVEDAARMLSVLAGRDAGDPFTADTAPADYTRFLGGDVRGLRVGVPRELCRDVDPEVARRFAEACTTLGKLGCAVEEVPAPSADELALCSAAGLIVSRAEGAAYHAPTLGQPELYTPDVFAQLDEATRVSAVDYVQALRYRREFIARIDDVFRAVDVLATPTVPVPAPLAGEAEAVMVLLARNSIPWSFGWFPTLDVPSGLTAAGLPCSVQFVAPHYQDGRLLTLGAAYERATPFELPDF